MEVYMARLITVSRIIPIVAFLVVVMTIPVLADGKDSFAFNLFLTGATDMASIPGSFDNIMSSFNQWDALFYGVGTEFVFNYFGFGFNGTVNWVMKDISSTDKNFYFNWDGQVYVSLHIFKAHTLFLDPYIRGGFGSDGRIFADYVSYSDAYSNYWYIQNAYLSNLSVYPFAAAGVRLILGGLMIGADIELRPIYLAIPFTVIEPYPGSYCRISLQAGFSF